MKLARYVLTDDELSLKDEPPGEGRLGTRETL